MLLKKKPHNIYKWGNEMLGYLYVQLQLLCKSTTSPFFSDSSPSQVPFVSPSQKDV